MEALENLANIKIEFSELGKAEDTSFSANNKIK